MGCCATTEGEDENPHKQKTVEADDGHEFTSLQDQPSEADKKLAPPPPLVQSTPSDFATAPQLAPLHLANRPGPNSLAKSKEEEAEERREREKIKAERGAPKQMETGPLDVIKIDDDDVQFGDGTTEEVIAFQPPSPERPAEKTQTQQSNVIDESLPDSAWFMERSCVPPRCVEWYQTNSLVHVKISPCEEGATYELRNNSSLCFLNPAVQSNLSDGENPRRVLPQRCDLCLLNEVKNPSFDVKNRELIVTLQKVESHYWRQLIKGPSRPYQEISWILRNQQMEEDEEEDN